MLLLVCFALSYAIVGTAGQLRRDAARGVHAARKRAWASAVRRVGNMRAGGPRHVGWWLWLTGATAYYTGRYTYRGARTVGRSIRTGWSKGWRRGKDKYEQRTARRTTHECTDACDHGGRRHGGSPGPDQTFADRWRSSRRHDKDTDRPADAAGEDASSAGPDQPLGDQADHSDRSSYADQGSGSPSSGPGGDGAVSLEPCGRCGVYASSEHSCDTPQEREPGSDDDVPNGAVRGPVEQVGELQGFGVRHGAGVNGNGTGVLTMASTTTGEATNIEAARTALQALRTEAEQTVSRVDQLAGSLQSANVDAQTLGEVAEVLDAVDSMKAAANKALSGLESRHAAMEEAVNSTPHAANTDWYRH